MNGSREHPHREVVEQSDRGELYETAGGGGVDGWAVVHALIAVRLTHSSIGTASAQLEATRLRHLSVILLDNEFSALGADNVLSLLARGREAGVGVLLATQELADLERAGRGFRDQVLGITAVTLAHRQEVHESALAISRLAGTRKVWRETRTIPAGLGPGGRVPATRGTLRAEEEPVVHPNAIKRLSTGELVLLSGVPRPTVARVRVTPRSPAPPPRRGIRSRARGAQPPAPGVTR